jgi:hypothetical protein
MEIKNYTPVGSPEVKTFTLTEEMYYAIEVGDTYTVTVGCLKRKTEDCRDKFGNGINYQGFPSVPSEFQANEVGNRT